MRRSVEFAAARVIQVQGDLISKVVGTLRPALWNEAKAAVSKRPVASLQGYDLYLKALSVWNAYSKEAIVESFDLLDQAISISPNFLDAHYAISEYHLNLWRFNRSDDPQESLRLARLHAGRAMEIDQSDYRGHYQPGLLHLFADHEHDLALVLAKTGIATRPKSLSPRRILIVALVEMSRLDEAKQEVVEFLSIRPGFHLSTFRNTPFKYRSDQDRYFNAMRKAGIPD